MPYIGKSPTGSGVRTRYYFTATGGETSISGSDDGGKTLSFSDGEYVDVYLNGIQLVAGTDYGTGTANTISGLAALAASDIVEVVVYDIYNVAKINSEAVRTRHYFTATGGETSIGTSQITGLTFSAGADIEVKLNGISLVQGTDYNTTTANTVGGLTALTAGQVIEIVIYEKFQLADTVSKAQGGNFGGAIGVGTIKEATGLTTAMTIDSSGLILTPARPAFHVVRSSSMSASGDVTYNAAKFNIGSHMDISTGLFTAPISGIYMFTFQCIYEAANGFADVYAKLNGTVDSGVWSLRPQNPQQTTYSSLPSASILLQLTANDTLGMNSTSALYSDANQWVRFSGCLIG